MKNQNYTVLLSFFYHNYLWYSYTEINLSLKLAKITVQIEGTDKMIQRFSTNFGVFSIFFDYFLAFISLVIVRYGRPLLSSLPFVNNLRKPPEIPLTLFIIFPLIWVIFHFFFSVYDGKKNLRIIDEFSSITISSVLVMATSASILYFSYRDMSRIMILLYFALTYLLMLLWRAAVRGIYINRIREKQYDKKILIIGAGVIGEKISKKLNQLAYENATVIGFLDDDQNKIETNSSVLGSIDQVRKFVCEHQIDQIVVALPTRATERIKYIINQVSDLPVQVSIIPDYFGLTMNRLTIKNLFGFPMLDLHASALNEYQRLTKRIFDVVITSLGLIPAIPVMIIISLIILIFDGRPILFSHKRVGENGQVFRLYKFRTMERDAEKRFHEVQQTDSFGRTIYKVENDPRVTRLGKFLRRFSLDELPQLFQILRGTMSLVGPRPEMPEIVDTYEKWQRIRLSVPQGLTGWWQVQGRSDKPLHLHIEDDLYYINNYSIWLDIQIVIKTIWIVLRGKGAY